MPAASTRATWKGAISFGLVHIPIELRSGVAETRQSFKWIDPRTNSAVGNQQVSKTTGEAIAPGDIVKGIETDDGRFVTLTKEEIRAALPKSTQTIEIEAFVDAGSIPLAYFSKPYHVAPVGKGQKAYELLRATLEKTNKVGIARVVIATRQHLAALMPEGRGMILDLLRWSDEVRSMEGLPLPDADIAVNAKELKMAEMLVEDLSADWEPDLFHDEFKEQLARLVEAKSRAGKSIDVGGLEREEAAPSADVLDLSELLKRSLHGKGQSTRPARAPARPSKAANESNVTPLKRAAATKKAPTARATAKPAAPAARATKAARSASAKR